MKNDNIFLNLNLSDLSALPDAIHIDNKFILIDNFDDTENECDEAYWYCHFHTAADLYKPGVAH